MTRGGTTSRRTINPALLGSTHPDIPYLDDKLPKYIQQMVEKAWQPNASKRDTETAFLALITEWYPVTHAAKCVGYNSDTMYKWAQGDSDFSQAWESATQSSNHWLLWQLRYAIVHHSQGWATLLIVALKMVKLFIDSPSMAQNLQINVSQERPYQDIPLSNIYDLIQVLDEAQQSGISVESIVAKLADSVRGGGGDSQKALPEQTGARYGNVTSDKKPPINDVE